MPADESFEKLTPREITDFPKTCKNCGKIYRTETEYITETQNLRGPHNGLREVSDESGRFLEVFRNCICGSTLMNPFDSRRDNSKKGDRRRKLFDDCMNAMVTGGIDKENAKKMLRKLIRNDV